MKRKSGIPVLLFVALLILLYLGGDLPDLLTIDTPAPATAPTSSTARTGGTESLACASYREHRKEVNVDLLVPVLTDKKAPTYKVVRVIDGDTIIIDKDGTETRVRLMAMDTPERTTTRNGVIEHFGEEAYKYAEKLIEQSDWQVRVTYDQVKVDQYGRELAYVWLKDGRMLNAVMVADGYAYSYTSSPKPQHVDLFLGLMRQAREQGLGLWGECE